LELLGIEEWSDSSWPSKYLQKEDNSYVKPKWTIRASPTVLHIAFAFLIFAEIHKNTSPIVLHIGFALLET